jgi:beta-mannanase
MKKIKYIYCSLAVLVIVSSLPYVNYRINEYYKTLRTDAIRSAFEEAIVGLYNRTPNGIYVDNPSIQHKSITFDQSVNDVSIKKVLAELKKDEPALITVMVPGVSGKNCLIEISNGLYDKQIQSLCEFVAHNRQTVYLRLDPAIEVPVHIYPWQYQSPIVFKNAFRHFAFIAKKAAPKVQLVWGTDGYPGVEEYWPGSDVVDCISITINSKSESVATAYPHTNDSVMLIKRKIHRMRFMNKPILFLNEKGIGNDDAVRKTIVLAVDEVKKDESIIYETATQINPDDSVRIKRNAQPTIGVYDPKRLLLSLQPIGVEHLFVDVKDIKSGYFEQEFTSVMSRHHDAILSIEPMIGEDSTVLTKTISGFYDEEFSKLYRIISKAPQIIYVRFAHEMEIPIHRYPWQSQDPALYIKAFRYFMNFEGSQSKNIRKVWGPAGDRGSMEWWPGSDVVDYISIAIYGLPDKNITDPNQQESFSDIYSRKVYRMRFANKPIFITEFGVKGDEGFQRKWLNDAAYCIRKHPEITGVSYFNLADNPKVWGNIPAPDWSVNRKTFTNFTRILCNGN